MSDMSDTIPPPDNADSGEPPDWLPAYTAAHTGFADAFRYTIRCFYELLPYAPYGGIVDNRAAAQGGTAFGLLAGMTGIEANDVLFHLLVEQGGVETAASMGLLPDLSAPGTAPNDAPDPTWN